MTKELSSKEKKQGCAGLVAIFIVIVIAVAWCTSGDDDTKPTYDRFSAVYDSQQFVEKKLKAPSTAKFGSDTINTVKINDTTFLVNNFVDSQNSFGAMLRMKYSCTITYLPSIGKVQCNNLILEDN